MLGDGPTPQFHLYIFSSACTQPQQSGKSVLTSRISTKTHPTMNSRLHPSLLAHLYAVARQEQIDHPNQPETSHPQTANQVPQRPVPVTMAPGSSGTSTPYGAVVADARIAQASVERMLLLQQSAGVPHAGWTPNTTTYFWTDEQQMVYTRGYLDGLQTAQNTLLNMQVGTLNRYSPYPLPGPRSTHGQYLPTDPQHPTYFIPPPPYHHPSQYFIPEQRSSLPAPPAPPRLLPAPVGGPVSPTRRRPQKAEKPAADQVADRQGRGRLEAVLKGGKAAKEEDDEVNVVD